MFDEKEMNSSISIICVMKVHRFRKGNLAAEMLICARDDNSEERNRS